MYRIFGYDAVVMFVKDLAMNVGDSCQQMVQDSPADNNGFDKGEAPQAVFNVLDSILKGTLDRLKTIRCPFVTAFFCHSYFNFFYELIIVFGVFPLY